MDVQGVVRCERGADYGGRHAVHGHGIGLAHHALHRDVQARVVLPPVVPIEDRAMNRRGNLHLHGKVLPPALRDNRYRILA